MTKVLTVRIDNCTYKQMEYYRQEQKQSDFVREAVLEKIDKIRRQRAGHKFIVLDNPIEINRLTDKEQKELLKQVLTLFENVNVDIKILEIIKFIKQSIDLNKEKLIQTMERDFKKEKEFLRC